MRVVLDTNVLVSAVLSPDGPPAGVLRAWRQGAFELVTSPALLKELQVVLSRPRISRRLSWSADERAEFEAALSQSAILVEPPEELRVILADPADNRVLEAATAGRADYIVSGDTDLLGLHEYEGCLVLAPARFIALLTAGP